MENYLVTDVVVVWKRWSKIEEKEIGKMCPKINKISRDEARASRSMSLILNIDWFEAIKDALTTSLIIWGKDRIIKKPFK